MDRISGWIGVEVVGCGDYGLLVLSFTLPNLHKITSDTRLKHTETASFLKKAVEMQILLCKKSWPHPELTEDHLDNLDIWREVTETFHDEMLGCLPPMDWNNGKFLVSEAYNYSSEHQCNIHCCLATVGKRYFARYVPRNKADRMVNELKANPEAHGPSLLTPA